MRAIIQRVSSATVSVDANTAGHIEKGLLVYLGVAKDDTEKDARAVARKIAELRVFEDDAGKMNLDVKETGGAVLIISNFTVAGNCRKGRRPSFDTAAEPTRANELYELVAEIVQEYGMVVARGIFQAHMHVESVNDGPVNFILDTDSS